MKRSLLKSLFVIPSMLVLGLFSTAHAAKLYNDDTSTLSVGGTIDITAVLSSAVPTGTFQYFDWVPNDSYFFITGDTKFTETTKIGAYYRLGTSISSPNVSEKLTYLFIDDENYGSLRIGLQYTSFADFYGLSYSQFLSSAAAAVTDTGHNLDLWGWDKAGNSVRYALPLEFGNHKILIDATTSMGSMSSAEGASTTSEHFAFFSKNTYNFFVGYEGFNFVKIGFGYLKTYTDTNDAQTLDTIAFTGMTRDAFTGKYVDPNAMTFSLYVGPSNWNVGFAYVPSDNVAGYGMHSDVYQVGGQYMYALNDVRSSELTLFALFNLNKGKFSSSFVNTVNTTAGMEIFNRDSLTLVKNIQFGVKYALFDGKMGTYLETSIDLRSKSEKEAVVAVDNITSIGYDGSGTTIAGGIFYKF